MGYWWATRLGTKLFCAEIRGWFDIPPTATKLHLSLHDRPAACRYKVQVDRYRFDTALQVFGCKSPRDPEAVVTLLAKTSVALHNLVEPHGICYMQIEYEE